MLGFIYSNRTIFVIIGIIFVLVIVYFAVKKLPTKAKKKEKVDNKKDESKDKKEETKQEEISVKQEEQVQVDSEEKTQNTDKKSEKEDKKPKIIQIYKRESRVQPDEKPKAIDPIYDRNVEFVNTSKNIAKFKSFVKEEEKVAEEMVDEFGFVTDEQEDCEFCEDKVKHFDHSKRMSNIMKGDSSDDMFASHISEKYLNINSDRHLKLDEVFNRKLFEKTEQMMKNSGDKINSRDGVESVTPRYSLWGDGQTDCQEEVDLSDDDVKINMKTALIADTYFNRRKKK